MTQHALNLMWFGFICTTWYLIFIGILILLFLYLKKAYKEDKIRQERNYVFNTMLKEYGRLN